MNGTYGGLTCFISLEGKTLNFTVKETNRTDAFEGKKQLNDWSHLFHSHRQSYSQGKTWTRSWHTHTHDLAQGTMKTRGRCVEVSEHPEVNTIILQSLIFLICARDTVRFTFNVNMSFEVWGKGRRQKDLSTAPRPTTATANFFRKHFLRFDVRHPPSAKSKALRNLCYNLHQTTSFSCWADFYFMREAD